MLRLACESVVVALAATTLAAAANSLTPLVRAPDTYVFGCTAEEARPVDFNELQQSPERFLRQCVRIEGILNVRNDIFADEGDVYRHIDQLVTGKVEGIGIGTYASNLTVGEWPYRGRVEVIGRAFSCAEVYRELVTVLAEENKDSGPQPPPMLWGYCHYYGNAIVYVSRTRILQQGPLRLTGKEAAAKYGDLDDLQAAHPLYEEVTHRTAQWIDAVSKVGSPEHEKALKYCGAADVPDASYLVQRESCRRVQAEWLARFSAQPRRSLRYFLRKTKWFNGEPGDYDAYACFCRVSSCQDIWPIHSIDTSLDERYACKTIARPDRD